MALLKCMLSSKTNVVMVKSLPLPYYSTGVKTSALVIYICKYYIQSTLKIPSPFTSILLKIIPQWNIFSVYKWAVEAVVIHCVDNDNWNQKQNSDIQSLNTTIQQLSL